MEIEAKFSVPDLTGLERLESVTNLGGYTVGAGERRRDDDVFLDTADRAILRAGYYLRRRHAGGGLKMTLKQLVSDAAGVLRREELEAVVATADTPLEQWPNRALRQRLRGIIDGARLLPLLELEQERLARPVYERAREVAELSLDRVHVGGADGFVWYEAELELRRQGTDADLARLVAALREETPLSPEPRSKFARALDALESAGAIRGGGALFSHDERVRHQQEAAKGDSRSRRALALLALDDGLTQVEAGRLAGLSDRQVRHWLASYRRQGLAIYGAVHAAMEAAAGSVRAVRIVPVAVVEPAHDEAAVETGAAAVKGEAASVPVLTGAAPEAVTAAAPEVAEETEAAEPEVPEPAAAHGKKRPAIDAGDSMTAAAVSTLRFHLERMLEHEEGTRLGEDPEELHDMRVSTRRMRMALRVFADYLDPAVMRPVRRGLRRTGATLGAVRDLDVFYEKTRHYLDGLPPERAGDLDGLLAAWRGEREKQREQLVAYLDSARYRHFLETTHSVLDKPLEELAPAGDGVLRPQRVSQVLPGILFQDLAAVWVFEGQIEGPETPLVTFHALRKACKGLRYTLEFFEGVLGPGAKPLIKAVKGLQDHLGDLQDAVVTCGVLRDYITWGEWRHEGHTLPEPTELIVAPGAARYLAARQEEMERLVLSFPEVWPTVAGPEFSRRLASVIAEI